MATVFLLGPSEWLDTQTGPSPREQRRELAGILRNHGHRIILMEDELDRQGEDMVGKFDRLLRSSTDVVIYWPTKATMSTTIQRWSSFARLAKRDLFPVCGSFITRTLPQSSAGCSRCTNRVHEAGTSRASLCLVSGRFRGGRPRTCASAPPSWPRSSAEGHMPACPATMSALHSNALDLAQGTERPMARALAMGGRSPCVVNPRA